MLEIADLKKKLDPNGYHRQFPPLQEKLRVLQYAVRGAEVPTIIALEGWDGSGRGNIIKHLLSRLDPRLVRVYAGSPPSPLELRHHFLWRYQVRLPNDGEMAIFDHSWYGRVLVERADKLARKKEWRAAYEEINQFERWLTDDGQVLIKIWLHISKKEQKRRFAEFKKDPSLAWKVTAEYKRHHHEYDKWTKVVEEMLEKTDSPHAPWTVVAAEDLRAARVQVFQALTDRLQQALDRRTSKPAEVSRTVAAHHVTDPERAKRAVHDRQLAKSQARKEGLPLTEE
jgi:AMP-polyphosphate phosphotransferase